MYIIKFITQKVFDWCGQFFLTREYTLVHKTLDLNKEGGSRQQHLNVTFSSAKTAPSTPVGVGVLPAKQRAHLSRTNSCGIGASPSGTKLCNRGLEGSTNQAYSSGFYFRVSWILMVGPCFWQNYSLPFLQVILNFLIIMIIIIHGILK